MKRRVMSAAAALALACAWTPAMARQDPAPPMPASAVAELSPRTEAFFRSLQSGDSTKAYRDMFAGTLMDAKPDELQTLVDQTNVYLNLYGTIVGWSLIRSDCLSPTYCRVIYQVDTKNGPLFYTLTVHRRSGAWATTAVSLTDRGQVFFDLPT